MSYKSSTMKDFDEQLRKRMGELRTDFELLEDFVMPVGIFLVIDKANGGDPTAQEVINRFKGLGRESGSVIDFYFLGWKLEEDSFSYENFHSCCTALEKNGVQRVFGGNADLILVDAHYSYPSGSVTLNFEKAVHVDLSAGIIEKHIPTVGGFLQSIINVATEVQKSAQKKQAPFVARISTRLGLAITKTSFIDYILKKWGELFGAQRVKNVMVVNIGPKVPTSQLALP